MMRACVWGAAVGKEEEEDEEREKEREKKEKKRVEWKT